MITIYTDGACSKNGREGSHGGYGVVVVQDDKIIDAHQSFCEETTNNREEMKAILWALHNYGAGAYEFEIPVVYSDSAYCVNTFNTWMHSWRRNGWLKSDNKKPENLDLIQDYYLCDKQIDLRHIKGHAGHKYNEIADNLATGKYKVEVLFEEEKEKEIEELVKPFEIATLKIEKDDDILIKVDTKVYDVEDAEYIHKYFSECYPKNNVIIISKDFEIEIIKGENNGGN